MEKVVENINKEMSRKKITRVELAVGTGIQQSNVSHYLNGDKPLNNLRVIKRIADFLNVEVWKLIK